MDHTRPDIQDAYQDESLMEEVAGLHDMMEDEVVFVYLDSDEVTLCLEAIVPLPAAHRKQLEKALASLIDRRQQRKIGSSANEFDLGVAEAFNAFMHDIFGRYRGYVGAAAQGGGFEFDVERFCLARDRSPETRSFLAAFRDTQIFERWHRQRCDIAEAGYTEPTRFEEVVGAAAAGTRWSRARRRMSTVLAASSPGSSRYRTPSSAG